MSNEILETLEQKEAELLRLYHETYGGGGSPFRGFKAFLTNGTRSGVGRKIVANFQPSATDTGKQTGATVASASLLRPNKTVAQQMGIQNDQVSEVKSLDNEADQSGAAVVVEGRDIVLDIENLSITAVSEKYRKDELTEYAITIDATVNDAMNSKQIIKSIAAKLKADESKG
jgi:hypothetical protein